MTKQYLCDIDGSVFSNEKDLIEHIQKNFVKTFEGKHTDLTELQSTLSKEYPEWQINIENGAGWYAAYIIKLAKGSTNIEQYFSNEKSGKNQNYSYQRNPETFSDLIKEINWKMETSNKIVEMIKSLGKFSDVYCKEFDHGYSSDEHHFTFGHKIKEDDEYTYVNYYPWGDNSDVISFVSDYKKYYITVLEGEVASHYEDGYFDTYKVNGVSIDGLINRAKKIRIEIIE